MTIKLHIVLKVPDFSIKESFGIFKENTADDNEKVKATKQLFFVIKNTMLGDFAKTTPEWCIKNQCKSF